ncbi:MAG TPA: carotenoid biosynthesis protein [Thermodesulfovibrionales bacterium]|nr:carotenoid biosynthesis protein [Thermodesulfovibrionales bacterium]
MEFLFLLFNTVLLRPYVFAFLLGYLFSCSMHLGAKRAVLFVIAGYLIAWLSEYSSIHNGFPYGYYYYIEQTRGREIWVFGVPFMDSLSYVFLAYASYSMALMVTAPVLPKGTLYLLETKKMRSSLYTRVLGALFFVYLDIIIDPVALQGSKWFLGQIYGYPEKGAYFGIPISNFVGWLVVGFLMIYALQGIDRYLDRKKAKDYVGFAYPWRYLIGPGLYLSVLVFNLSMTFAIGDYHLGWTGIFIVLLPLFLICSLTRLKRSPQEHGEALKAHRADFPRAVIPEEARRLF